MSIITGFFQEGIAEGAFNFSNKKAGLVYTGPGLIKSGTAAALPTPEYVDIFTTANPAVNDYYLSVNVIYNLFIPAGITLQSLEHIGAGALALGSNTVNTPSGTTARVYNGKGDSFLLANRSATSVGVLKAEAFMIEGEGQSNSLAIASFMGRIDCFVSAGENLTLRMTLPGGYPTASGSIKYVRTIDYALLVLG